MSTQQVRALSAYVALALIWGLSFLFMRKVVAAFGLVGAVCFRAFIAFAILRLIAAIKRQPVNLWQRKRAFSVVGATTVAGQLIGLSYATQTIGTAMTAILAAGIPLFAALIGHVWGIEKIRWGRAVGLFLGIIGIILLVGFPPFTMHLAFFLGCTSALGGALCSAIGSNYASVRLKDESPNDITMGAFLSGGLWTLPLLLVSPVIVSPGLKDYANLLVLSALMSALAYVLYFRLVATIGATRAVSVEFAVTIVAIIVGTAFLGESLTAMQGFGTAIIIVGCALVLELLPWKKDQPSAVS